MNAEQEDPIRRILRGIVTRFGGAIEFWTVACLSQEELGAPGPFVELQWGGMVDDVHALRSALADQGYDPHPAVQEQFAKLTKTCSDIREVFDAFICFTTLPRREVEQAVVRLGQLWDDVRLRVGFLGVLLPLRSPLGELLTTEQENYYQNTLDGLYDQFEAARPASVFD